MIILLSLSFIAGLIAVISPCVLPMVPVVFAGSYGSWKRGFLIIAGMILMFMSLGYIASFVGKLWIFSFVAYAGLTLFGVIMIDDRLYERYSVYSSRVVGKLRVPADSLLFGALLGIIWSPCIGPIIGALLSYNALNSSEIEGMLSMLFFGLGIATSISLIIKAGERGRILSSLGERLRKLSGYIIIAFVILSALGIIDKLEMLLSAILPI